jgi:hypothetical protein
MESSSTLKKRGTPTIIYDKLYPDDKRLEREKIEWLENFCNTAPCEQMLSFVLDKSLLSDEGRGRGYGSRCV